MNKIIIALLATLVTYTNLQAQGFLKKLKDQAGEVASAVSDVANLTKLHVNKESALGTPTNVEKKSAEDDYKSTDLDKISAKKDEWNLGGIYYCTEILYAASSTGQGSRGMRKFLLEFEGIGTGVKMQISNRYSYNKPGNTMVDPFTATMDDLTNACVENYKIQQQFYVHDFQTKWNYVTNEYRKELGTDQFAIKEKPVYSMFSSLTFYVIKPGLIIAMSDPYYDRTTEDKTAILKYATPVVLYKKEMEAEATALTRDNIVKLLANQNKKYEEARTKEVKRRADEMAKWEAENPNWREELRAKNNGSSSSSANTSKKSGTEKSETKQIKFEIQNKSGDQIFLKYDGDINGSSFIGAGSIISYKAKAGAKIMNKKTGAVYVVVSASTDGERIIVQ